MEQLDSLGGGLDVVSADTLADEGLEVAMESNMRRKICLIQLVKVRMTQVLLT